MTRALKLRVSGVLSQRYLELHMRALRGPAARYAMLTVVHAGPRFRVLFAIV